MAPVNIRFFNTVEPVTTFYRDLIPYLAGRGMVSEVLLSRTEYRQGRGELANSLLDSGGRVWYIPAGLKSIDRGWKKAWVIVTYGLGAMLRSLLGSPVGLNFFLTQPPFFPIWGAILKKVRRQPYICLQMDLYPDVIIQDGALDGDSWLACWLKRSSRFMLRHADAVVVIGRCMRDRVVGMGIPAERIHLIHNWANPANVSPVPSQANGLRAEYGLDKHFVVLYSGNMGVSHNFTDLIEAARSLSYLNDLRFVMIGDGVRRIEIERAIADFLLDNILLLPFQPYERLSESLSLGDVHYISLRDGFEGLVVPSKAYGSFAAGRPVIYQGSSEGEIASLVAEEDVGKVVSNGDTDGLVQAILYYYQKRGAARETGERALALSNGKLNYRNSLYQYETLIRNLARP